MFEQPNATYLAVSPFRLGEFPNVRTGIATISTSSDAVKQYKRMIERLWKNAAKGEEGAAKLRNLLKNFQ